MNTDKPDIDLNEPRAADGRRLAEAQDLKLKTAR
jgi:hypothetical protein